MTAQETVERQRIFVAYREVFTGKNARIRKKKAVRRIIESQKCSPLVDISTINVVPILYNLLKNRIFESENLARKEFPDLFRSLENSRLINRDVAIDMAIEEKRNMSPGGLIKIENKEGNDYVESLTQDTIHAFQPLRFPFNIQHRLLSIVQQLLEESCFKFAEKRSPSILVKNGWTCAAAGELTKWLCVLKKLPDSCISTEEQASLNSICRTVAQLRHTVVHRLHVTSKQFLGMIRSAHTLAEILQDNKCVSTLQALYTMVDSHAQKMEQEGRAMQQEVHSRLLLIQRQKKALEKREQAIHLHVTKQTVDIPVAAGQALDESTNRLLAFHQLGIIAGKQSTTRNDENTLCTGYDVKIEESDIESDEDRLQAELE